MEYNATMRIGLISDTHDRFAAITTALQFFSLQKVDLIVHCGDWKSLATAVFFAEQAHALSLPVRGVLGNNDTDVAAFLNYSDVAPENFVLSEGILEFEHGDRQLAAYHGHHAPTLRQLRGNASKDIVLLGHTHKPLIEHVEGRLIANPGSTAFSIPRRKDWQPSVALIETATLDARIVYL